MTEDKAMNFGGVTQNATGGSVNQVGDNTATINHGEAQPTWDDVRTLVIQDDAAMEAVSQLQETSAMADVGEQQLARADDAIALLSNGFPDALRVAATVIRKGAKEGGAMLLDMIADAIES